jgi:FtsH-binding integral membrane protein
MVDNLVALLRDRTVRPLTLVTRAIVFGIIVFAASVVTIVLLSITLIRILTVYAFDGRVWLADLVVGVLFVVIGIVAWSQRRDPTAPVEDAA